MPYTVEHYKTRVEWLSHRGIGGSSASSILGVNPFRSAVELYGEIIMSKPVTEEYEDKKNTESKQYGNKLEPIIRKVFRLDYPEYIVRDPQGFEMYRRKDKPYMTATLDGTLVDRKTKEKGILEIKTRDMRKHEDRDEWDNHIPMNYYVQVLHYMLVKDDTSFAVLFAKQRFFEEKGEGEWGTAYSVFKPYYIYRSDEQVQKDLLTLEKAETRFWEEYVLKRQIPPLKI